MTIEGRSGIKPVGITDLLKSVEGAVAKAKSKALVVEQTKAAFDAASQDAGTANAELAKLRDDLHAQIGELLPNLGNPRVVVR